jgi:hypothetical protein
MRGVHFATLYATPRKKRASPRYLREGIVGETSEREAA